MNVWMFIIFWVCWVAEKKNIDYKKLCKNQRKFRKKQAVIQAIAKTSTENNEQELHASSLLVPPQQPSGLGTLVYEVVVESMTSV